MSGLAVFCGNLDCATRRPGTLRTFTGVPLVDGKVWVCRECRTSTTAAAWPAAHPCPCGTVYDHYHSVTPTVTRPGGPQDEVAVTGQQWCDLCGEPLPEGSRADARYHPACRVAAHRRRQATDGELR